MTFTLQHSYLIPLLPLLAAMLVGFFGKSVFRGFSHLPIWAGVGASAVLSLSLLWGTLGGTGVFGHQSDWFRWFTAGDASTGLFSVNAGAWIDPLTIVMLCVVCGVGFLITVFAAGYMKGEAGYWRFFCYLGLFIFSMTCLVMGDNLILLYLGWEGVGTCSYLLIGYYFDKPAAREAAKKAFIVNRIGDLGFAVGIMLVWYCFGTVSYFGDGVGTNTGFVEMALNGLSISGTEQYIYWIPFALMLGAFGKSAQFPLHVWLPDAMEGPTPVSALIHAATMVTAGVYMIVRCGPVFVMNGDAMHTIAWAGAITALLGGFIALRQFDLKKVFAYSTISQLGFMFVAAAVLAPVAAVFHLITHAFFKALLFLSSGVIMHAMNGELDLRKMSGIKKHLPLTRILCLIGCAALAGLPLITAGFWSKDEIILATSHHSTSLYVLLSVTAFLTAYYSFRVYFRVFEGPEKIPGVVHGAHHSHAAQGSHGSHGAQAGPDGHATAGAHDGHDGHGGHGGHPSHEPALMMLPLIVLAIGAIGIGVINLPFDFGLKAHSLGHYLAQSPSLTLAHAGIADAGEATKVAMQFGLKDESAEKVSHVVPMVIASAIALGGILLAMGLHLVNRPASDDLARKLSVVATASNRKLWIDEVYQAVLVGPLRALSLVTAAFDRLVVDGIAVAVGMLQVIEGLALRNLTQRGYVQGYAMTGLIGLAVILFVVFAL
jgi:NADH-quinone oxidoreductase subunit L